MGKIESYLCLFLAVLSLTAVGACGVKPNDVDPPADASKKSFPTKYPKNVSQ
ncbi:MAG: hypothetical protein AAF988_00840 [Pseudomonadota bacterium]